MLVGTWNQSFLESEPKMTAVLTWESARIRRVIKVLYFGLFIEITTNKIKEKDDRLKSFNLFVSIKIEGQKR